MLTGMLPDGTVQMREENSYDQENSDFLLEIGTMKEYQVQEVIRSQNAGDDRFFGEIALDLGYIKDDAI